MNKLRLRGSEHDKGPHIPLGNWYFTHDDGAREDLGVIPKIISVSMRPFACHFGDEITVYDPEHPKFKEISNQANHGVMSKDFTPCCVGVEVLVYVVQLKRFAIFAAGSRTSHCFVFGKEFGFSMFPSGKSNLIPVKLGVTQVWSSTIHENPKYKRRWAIQHMLKDSKTKYKLPRTTEATIQTFLSPPAIVLPNLVESGKVTERFVRFAGSTNAGTLEAMERFGYSKEQAREALTVHLKEGIDVLR